MRDETKALESRFIRRTLPDGTQIRQIERTFAAAVVKGDGDTYTVTVSDEGEDRYGDTINANGWDLSNYARNPVWLVDHDYRVSAIVGRGLNPRVESGRLVFDFAPDPINSSAATDMVLAKLDAGSLRAVSVGFIPTKWEKISNDKGEWTGGFRFLEQELLENSWVAVPANPRATLGLISAPDSTLPAPADAGHADVLSDEVAVAMRNIADRIVAAGVVARLNAAR